MKILHTRKFDKPFLTYSLQISSGALERFQLIHCFPDNFMNFAWIASEIKVNHDKNLIFDYSITMFEMHRFALTVILPQPASATVLYGDDGPNEFLGTPRSDQIYSRGGNDTIDSDEGDDLIGAGDGDDYVASGGGNDSVGGGLGDDSLLGGPGNDQIGGGRGNDTINGGIGNDQVLGGSGNDWLEGGDGSDTISGSFNGDHVNGGDGRDQIGGGFGADTVYGDRGNDIIGGGEGNDQVFGNIGDDFLAGGGRNDLLSGAEGSDTLNGGDGNDTLIGGEDADRFVFSNFKTGDQDLVVDFEDGIDRILIRLRDATTNQQYLSNNGNGAQGYFEALRLSDVNDGVRVDILGHYIVLQNLSVSALSSEDFIFV